jgi:hypothetical protein
MHCEASPRFPAWTARLSCGKIFSGTCPSPVPSRTMPRKSRWMMGSKMYRGIPGNDLSDYVLVEVRLHLRHSPGDLGGSCLLLNLPI